MLNMTELIAHVQIQTKAYSFKIIKLSAYPTF